jgi:DNA-binding GntR family transcriptional regulator
MQRAAEADETHDEAAADAAFHGRIVQLAGNATLERVWRTLEPYSRTYITIVAPGADRRRIADEHVPILEALRRRDPALATEVFHHHFANAAAMLGGLWERADPEPGPPQEDEGGTAGTRRRPPARQRNSQEALPSLAERTA